jgi:hypothetical protein
LFDHPKQFPGFAVGHPHLGRSFMQRACRLNPPQEIVRAIPKNLPVLIKPNFKDSLHAGKASKNVLKREALFSSKNNQGAILLSRK